MAKARFAWMLGVGLAFGFAAASGARGEEKFFEIRAKKFSYTPNMITVNKGDTVRIRLLSEDVHHGFYLDGYDVQTSAYPGHDGSLRFTADKTGRYIFRCSVTCGEFHPYMIGHLRVAPNSPFIVFGLTVVGIAAVSAVFAMRRIREGQGRG